MNGIRSTLPPSGRADEARAFERLRRTAPAGQPDVVFQIKSPDGGGLELRRADLTPKALRDLARLSQAADQFESVLAKQLLEAMDRTLPKGDFGGPMGQMARGFMNQAFAETVTRQGRGLGLADDLFRQLSRAVLSEEAARRRLQPETHENA